jgi:hypothetical protein
MLRLARLVFAIGSAVSLGVVVVVVVGTMAGARAAGWRVAAGADAVVIDDQPAIARRGVAARLEHERRSIEHDAKLERLSQEWKSVHGREFI